MKDNLDKEEKEILKSYARGDWKSVPDSQKKLELFQEIARNTLKKENRINIRISSRELLEIKRKAVYEGIPYQTLISSIIHKFLNGRLVNKAD